ARWQTVQPFGPVWGRTMGLLKRLFGGQPDTTPAASTASPHAAQAGRPIRYDPGLVDSLTGDPRWLLATFTRLREQVSAGGFPPIDAALQEFTIRLEAHLLTKNVRCYASVEQSMAGEEANTELIRGFRQEMISIARAVVEFV